MIPARFEDLAPGAAHTEAVEFTSERAETFGRVVEDSAPIHTDIAFAQSLGYRGILVHGAHVASRFSRILGMFLPGPHCVIHSLRVELPHPVYAGQTITFTAKVERLVPSVRTVVLSLYAANQEGHCVARGTAQCGWMPRDGREVVRLEEPKACREGSSS